MFSVYVLENDRGQRYTGSSADFEVRLQLHNDVSPEKAKFHRTTYGKGPWKVVFKKECLTRQEALVFEKLLKTGKGRDLVERARRGG